VPDWLTYAEIGKRFGLGTEAARTRVRRLGWRTQPGNDGRTLVLVPEDVDLRPAGDRPVRPDKDRGLDRPVTEAMTDLLDGALASLEDAVTTLREQLDVANARAERAETDRADEHQRADDLRAQIDTLTADLVVMRAEADRALTEERLRADEAEAARNEERARAGALGDRADELQNGQQLMMDMHARALAAAQDQLERVREAAEGLRQAEEERRARGLLARLRAAVKGR
jgi:hypothetical protein